MRILIVDDSSLIRLQIQHIFTKHFIDVQFETAASGLEALEKHRSFKPEVLLLDYIIPAPDGLAVLKILNKIDQQVKIIVITTLGNQKFIYKTCKEFGAAAVIAKPITEESLVKVFSDIQKNIGSGD